MKIFYSFVLTSLLFASSSSYSQRPATGTQGSPAPCRLIYDENQHLIIPQKGLVLLYFFNPRNEDSMDMKRLMEKLSLKKFSPSCFQIDTSLSLGLKRTYRVESLPAIAVLQDKKVIYGLTGFTDDNDTLVAYLEKGIQNHLIISQ